jgi:hypothetical protein
VGAAAPVIPDRYPFPPTEHPSWALWHAPRARWTSENGAPRHYGGLTVTPKPHKVDLELLDRGQNKRHLALRGVALDKVQMLVPYIFRDWLTGEAYNTSADLDVPAACQSSLHTAWRLLAGEAVRIHRLQSPDSPEALASTTDWNINVLDEFLRTTSREERNTTEANISPFRNKAFMSAFLPFWVRSYPNPKRDERGVIPMEPILDLLGLDADAADTVPMSSLDLLKDILQYSIDHPATGSFKGAYEQFARDLHHIKGRCLFVSEQGRIGHCPYGTKPGDSLVALQGARLASVLRPRPDVEIDDSMGGHGWMLIGEAMIPAWMDGQYVAPKVGGKEQMDGVYVLV